MAKPQTFIVLLVVASAWLRQTYNVIVASLRQETPFRMLICFNRDWHATCLHLEQNHTMSEVILLPLLQTTNKSTTFLFVRVAESTWNDVGMWSVAESNWHDVGMWSIASLNNNFSIVTLKSDFFFFYFQSWQTSSKLVALVPCLPENCYIKWTFIDLKDWYHSKTVFRFFFCPKIYRQSGKLT